MTYRVIKTTNEWNQYGAAINEKNHFMTTAETLVDAFKYFYGHRNPVEPISTKYRVEDMNGTQFALIDAYRQVVGEEVFQVQLADEGFSINLEDWLREQNARPVMWAVQMHIPELDGSCEFWGHVGMDDEFNYIYYATEQEALDELVASDQRIAAYNAAVAVYSAAGVIRDNCCGGRVHRVYPVKDDLLSNEMELRV